MKRPFSASHLVLLAGVLAHAGCSSELDEKAAAAVAEAAPTPSPASGSTASEGEGDLVLDATRSKVEFVGAKVSADHRGHFTESSGRARLSEDGELEELEVHVQTQSVSISPPMLEKHLRADDFFDVEKFPEAHFVLVSANQSESEAATHEVSGNLELRGVTKQITFPATVRVGDGGVEASASFKITRQDFGIVYRGMADDLIKDEVLLELELAFSEPSGKGS